MMPAARKTNIPLMVFGLGIGRVNGSVAEQQERVVLQPPSPPLSASGITQSAQLAARPSFVALPGLPATGIGSS